MMQIFCRIFSQILSDALSFFVPDISMRKKVLPFHVTHYVTKLFSLEPLKMESKKIPFSIFVHFQIDRSVPKMRISNYEYDCKSFYKKINNKK